MSTKPRKEENTEPHSPLQVLVPMAYDSSETKPSR